MVNTGLLKGISTMLDGEAPSKLFSAPATNPPATTPAMPSPMNGLTNGPGKPKPVKKSYDFGQELSKMGKTKIAFDEKPVNEIVKSAATKMGVSPQLLMSSSWVEGLNKAVADPDSVSEAYNMSSDKLEGFPVDGFFNYGLDRFGDNYNTLKKYLPKGFEERFKVFPATNEKGQKVKTAAFKTNEDALMAKAAFMKMEGDEINKELAKMGTDLDEDARDYFVMAAYNTGAGNAKKMLKEYMAAKDKKAFIEKGLTKFKDVHKNVSQRMGLRGAAKELLK